MKAKLAQDKKKRNLVKKFEKERKNYKSIYSNESLNNQIRIQALKNLQSLPRNSSSTRVKNRCILSGRSRGVQRDFKMSRIFFRKKAIEGYLPGIKKAS